MSTPVSDKEGLVGATLRRVGLFTSWSEEALNTLGTAAQLRLYNKGELVAEKGEPASDLFVTVRGTLTNERSWGSGKHMVLGIVQPDWPLRVAAAWDGLEQPYDLTARSDALVLRIPRETFVSVVKSDMQHLQDVLTFVSHQYRADFTRINLAVVGSLRIQVAAFLFVNILNSHLVLRDDPRGLDTDDQNVGITDVTQNELAAMIGRSRQRVNEIMRTMEKEGILRRRGRMIQITDFLLLKQVLEEDEPLPSAWARVMAELQARLEHAK